MAGGIAATVSGFSRNFRLNAVLQALVLALSRSPARTPNLLDFAA
jgi:hypothetical protein